MRSLQPLNKPAAVQLSAELDGHLLRFAHRERELAKAGAFATALVWLFVVVIAGPSCFIWLSGWARDAMLALWIAAALASLVFPVLSWLAGLQLARSTVQTALLTPHHVKVVGLLGNELARWTVHDLEEAWASRDLFSPIVAIRKRTGEVQALRVDAEGTALWLVEVLREWIQERATEPDEEGERLLAAVRARRGSPAAVRDPAVTG